jgi:hypothetical protein
VFNLFPDKRSKAYKESLQVESGSGHEQWLTVMAVDLPAGLPVGFGTVNVSTTATQATWPNSRIETVDIRLEILSGTGVPHSLQYKTATAGLQTGSLSKLQPISNQAFINPPFATCDQTQNYAAIEVKLQLPFVIEDPYVDTEWFSVVADDFSVMTGSKGPQVAWSARTNQLVVTFLNVDGKLKCYEPRFSLVPNTDASPDANVFKTSGPPQLLSVTYYDTNGAVVTGPAASEFTVTVR